MKILKVFAVFLFITLIFNCITYRTYDYPYYQPLPPHFHVCIFNQVQNQLFVFSRNIDETLLSTLRSQISSDMEINVINIGSSADKLNNAFIKPIRKVDQLKSWKMYQYKGIPSQAGKIKDLFEVSPTVKTILPELSVDSLRSSYAACSSTSA